MSETSTVERVPEGTVVRVTDDAGVEYDVPKGSEWQIGMWVDANDDVPEGYMVEPLPGSGRAGDWFVPATSVEVVRTAEEQAERMRMPTADEVVKLLSVGLVSAYDGDWEVFETEPERRQVPGEPVPFEHPNEFTHGVTFYARKRGGRGFGAIVRITGIWPIDD
jgi:hypothetical protein